MGTIASQSPPVRTGRDGLAIGHILVALALNWLVSIGPRRSHGNLSIDGPHSLIASGICELSMAVVVLRSPPTVVQVALILGQSKAYTRRGACFFTWKLTQFLNIYFTVQRKLFISNFMSIKETIVRLIYGWLKCPIILQQNPSSKTVTQRRTLIQMITALAPESNVALRVISNNILNRIKLRFINLGPDII